MTPPSIGILITLNSIKHDVKKKMKKNEKRWWGNIDIHEGLREW